MYNMTDAQYTQITANSVIKASPGQLYGLVVTASAAGTITLYDNASVASGNILLTLTGLTVGQIVNFAGVGIRAKNGIYAAVGGVATINVLWG